MIFIRDLEKEQEEKILDFIYKLENNGYDEKTLSQRKDFKTVERTYIFNDEVIISEWDLSWEHTDWNSTYYENEEVMWVSENILKLIED